MTEFTPQMPYDFNAYANLFNDVRYASLQHADGPEWSQWPIAGVVPGGEAVSRFVALEATVEPAGNKPRGLSARSTRGYDYGILWLSLDLDSDGGRSSRVQLAQLRYLGGAAMPFILAGELSGIDPPLTPANPVDRSRAETMPLQEVTGFWRRGKRERTIFGRIVGDFQHLTGTVNTGDSEL